MRFIRDKIITNGFVVVTILMLCPGTMGSWKKLEKLFSQDNYPRQRWDENRIIFPDMREDPSISSWQPTTSPIREEPKRPCESDCHVSREYSPVCGTNGVTYQNMGQLQCEISCGVDVDLHRPSACETDSPTNSTTQIPTDAISTEEVALDTQRTAAIDRCIKSCPSTPEYNPVCGTNRITYNNNGKLQCARVCGVDVELWRHAPCPRTATEIPPANRNENDVDEECITGCPSTPEYNPVCGTNRVTYNNLGKLMCAKLCGVDVKLWRHSRCPMLTPSTTIVEPTTKPDLDIIIKECIKICATTPEYNPVCGTNDVTYDNKDKLDCAKVCGVDVSVQKEGRCSAPPVASEFNHKTFDVDYGEDNIDHRFRPRGHREYY